MAIRRSKTSAKPKGKGGVKRKCAKGCGTMLAGQRGKGIMGDIFAKAAPEIGGFLATELAKLAIKQGISRFTKK